MGVKSEATTSAHDAIAPPATTAAEQSAAYGQLESGPRATGDSAGPSYAAAIEALRSNRPTPEQFLSVQRMAGNQAVGRLLRQRASPLVPPIETTSEPKVQRWTVKGLVDGSEKIKFRVAGNHKVYSARAGEQFGWSTKGAGQSKEIQLAVTIPIDDAEFAPAAPTSGTCIEAERLARFAAKNALTRF